MRIRWRGLELPSEVLRDESVSTSTYGLFRIEPFERGFGVTVGNSLRRVLLSSLEGAAVSSVKISGAPHEFMSIQGVLEDVTNIILNVKGLVVSFDADEPKTMKVQKNTKGPVLAGDIEADPAIEILDPDHVLATLTDDIDFEMEMVVTNGRGYATAEDNRGAEQEVGVIAVDSIFSPVIRVRYRTEDTRVGQRTNYDRLLLEVWTNGTVSPEDAVVEASKILRKHLNPFVQYYNIGSDYVQSAAPAQSQSPQVDDEMEAIFRKPVSELDLSVRSSNCLEAARIATVGELASKTEADLLRLRSFGKTSLREVRRKLADWGLSLGINTERDPSGAGAAAGPMEHFSSDAYVSGSTGDSETEMSVPADPS